MAIETITKDDPRFAMYGKGRNGRYPPTPEEGVAKLEFCDSTNDVAEALERLVHAGTRPTIRSGGHCYEDFTYTNPNGAVIDLKFFSQTSPVPGAGEYRLGAGVSLGTAYTDLYNRHLVTIPGGTCGTVGAGGHITGGGYGLLSRMYGVTSDWVTAADIVTVDAQGKAIPRRVSAKNDPDLWRAIRGAGGGSFGIVTNFYFDDLPLCPKEVIKANLNWQWADMTEEKFAHILTVYSNYFATRGKDPDTWGMFTIFGISHRQSGRFGLSIQFCNPDGTCTNLKPLEEFVALFDTCGPTVASLTEHPMADHMDHPQGPGEAVCIGQHTFQRHNWLEANVQVTGMRPAQPSAQANANGGGRNTTAGGNGNGAGRAIPGPAAPAVPQGSARLKYNSSYMRCGFTKDEIAIIWKNMNRNIEGADLRRCTLSTDSYGGAVNNKARIEDTSIAARDSVLKLQFYTSWNDPAQDPLIAQWLDDFYTELYSTAAVPAQYKGTPFWSDNYEGCYINYPDKGMTKYPFWTELYYGTKGLYPFLQNVKKKYDPSNIFHHAMSIKA